jgi:hypothetical protein
MAEHACLTLVIDGKGVRTASIVPQREAPITATETSAYDAGP